MNKTELTDIVAQLIKLGEDADELNFWLEIYDRLEPAQQSQLFANLKRELETLQ